MLAGLCWFCWKLTVKSSQCSCGDFNANFKHIQNNNLVFLPRKPATLLKTVIFCLRENSYWIFLRIDLEHQQLPGFFHESATDGSLVGFRNLNLGTGAVLRNSFGVYLLLTQTTSLLEGKILSGSDECRDIFCFQWKCQGKFDVRYSQDTPCWFDVELLYYVYMQMISSSCVGWYLIKLDKQFSCNIIIKTTHLKDKSNNKVK